MHSPIAAASQLTPALMDARPEFKTNSVEDAAQEFEGMLIGLLLKSAREAGSVFDAEDRMTGGEGYLELAEQQLAKTLADSGILGFSRMLLRDIDRVEGRQGGPQTPERTSSSADSRIDNSTAQQISIPTVPVLRSSSILPIR